MRVGAENLELNRLRHGHLSSVLRHRRDSHGVRSFIYLGCFELWRLTPTSTTGKENRKLARKIRRLFPAAVGSRPRADKHERLPNQLLDHLCKQKVLSDHAYVAQGNVPADRPPARALCQH